ncbi:hypothetical protein N779_02845 [Vibrio coralliilyticus OCN008]|nr:hypothetical protein N779_02845 [Vibrio coralliilyticus OCN008]
MPKINIAVFNYPFALKSAVFGFEELFHLANRACRESELEREFKAHIIDACNMPPRQFDVVLLPPSIDDQSTENQTHQYSNGWLSNTDVAV